MAPATDTASFSRAKRRRLAGLQEQVNLAVEADRRFFVRHPHRTHRLRHASRAEVAILEEVHGAADVRIPADERWFCVVKVLDVETETRTRLFAANDRDIDTDLPERECAWVFDRISGRNSNVAIAEAAILSAVRRWRGGR